MKHEANSRMLIYRHWWAIFVVGKWWHRCKGNGDKHISWILKSKKIRILYRTTKVRITNSRTPDRVYVNILWLEQLQAHHDVIQRQCRNASTKRMPKYVKICTFHMYQCLPEKFSEPIIIFEKPLMYSDISPCFLGVRWKTRTGHIKHQIQLSFMFATCSPKKNNRRIRRDMFKYQSGRQIRCLRF